MKQTKYRLRIVTDDNEPIIKATAEKIEDFEPLMKTLKLKLSGRK